MPNRVEEQLRAIDNTIGYHKLKIKQLNEAKKELMDKYEIPYGDDDITVVERTTAEREQEAIELFNKCKPLLDKGYSLRKAVMEVKDLTTLNTKLAWYRELKEIVEKEGYEVRV